MGVATNPFIDKSERVNTLEIGTQQDIQERIKSHIESNLIEGFEEFNYKFGYSIELEQEEYTVDNQKQEEGEDYAG